MHQQQYGFPRPAIRIRQPDAVDVDEHSRWGWWLVVGRWSLVARRYDGTEQSASRFAYRPPTPNHHQLTPMAIPHGARHAITTAAASLAAVAPFSELPPVDRARLAAAL